MDSKKIAKAIIERRAARVTVRVVLEATTRIDFAMFTFAESFGIDDTMKMLASNGVQVQGVLDWKASNQKWAANHGLKGLPNISLFRAKPGGGMRKLHHKLMVIDGQVVIGGSFNYTGPANRLNDENIFMFGNLKPGHSQASTDASRGTRSRRLTGSSETTVRRFNKRLVYPQDFDLR